MGIWSWDIDELGSGVKCFALAFRPADGGWPEGDGIAAYGGLKNASLVLCGPAFQVCSNVLCTWRKSVCFLGMDTSPVSTWHIPVTPGSQGKEQFEHAACRNKAGSLSRPYGFPWSVGDAVSYLPFWHKALAEVTFSFPRRVLASTLLGGKHRWECKRATNLISDFQVLYTFSKIPRVLMTFNLAYSRAKRSSSS
jgi:hypothetical protein